MISGPSGLLGVLSGGNCGTSGSGCCGGSISGCGAGVVGISGGDGVGFSSGTRCAMPIRFKGPCSSTGLRMVFSLSCAVKQIGLFIAVFVPSDRLEYEETGFLLRRNISRSNHYCKNQITLVAKPD
jgi:hypothetical protein